jgi:hypothetical protein
MNNTYKNSMCVAAAALVTAATSFAGTTTLPTTTVKPKSASIDISGSLGVDVASSLVYRGVVLDNNPVVQPRLDVAVPLGADNIALKLSTVETLGTKSPLNGLTRTENEIGVAVKVGSLTVTPSFQTVYSPTSKYQSSEGVNLNLRYDDSALLGAFALKPHVSAFVTTNGTNNNGTGSSGKYYEVGVAPSTTVLNTKVSLPVSVGFGSDNYYAGNKSRGYTSAGLAAERAVTDRVSVKASLTYFDTPATTGGNTSWVTAGGVSVSF